ncbi:PiggyBac transposable element-derived protein 3 [Acipenser ruthenus]|uniref:PiggyBac transposable element-derived protein 3 n=1 Tax=Acipenser ruthenus TaxID=7906 RepID=A0A444UJ11_ACIRT|nr:PiggyBac transposable element-derived protein 3 [Acipenser ruthenus]
MVPFKGRNRLKQYLPSKPKKWGYKILVLAGSDGVPHNLEIYTGRVVQPPELADVGASGNIVLLLAQPIPKQEKYKLFFDNWFTSVPLVLTLAQQGIHCTGTVRGNRLPGVNLMCDAELKRAGRGSFEQKMAMVGETTLHVVKWYDNRSVTLLSDYTGAHPVTEVDRAGGGGFGPWVGVGGAKAEISWRPRHWNAHSNLKGKYIGNTCLKIGTKKQHQQSSERWHCI